MVEKFVQIYTWIWLETAFIWPLNPKTLPDKTNICSAILSEFLVQQCALLWISIVHETVTKNLISFQKFILTFFLKICTWFEFPVNIYCLFIIWCLFSSQGQKIYILAVLFILPETIGRHNRNFYSSCILWCIYPLCSTMNEKSTFHFKTCKKEKN